MKKLALHELVLVAGGINVSTQEELDAVMTNLMNDVSPEDLKKFLKHNLHIHLHFVPNIMPVACTPCLPE